MQRYALVRAQLPGPTPWGARVWVEGRPYAVHTAANGSDVSRAAVKGWQWQAGQIRRTCSLPVKIWPSLLPGRFQVTALKSVMFNSVSSPLCSSTHLQRGQDR